MNAVSPVGHARDELEFAQRVDRLKADANGWPGLIELLHEGHPVYRGRSAAATMRMRGWILLALGDCGRTEEGLVYLLEELDNGGEAYLVACAAHSLGRLERPSLKWRPYVERAMQNIRSHDDAVCLEHYGGEVAAPPYTTAKSELEGLARRIDASAQASVGSCCCGGAASSARPAAAPGGQPLPPVTFEDHDGARIEGREFFVGRPSIIVFFYTRCTNPQKCSLTVSKLGRLRAQLVQRGLAARIRSAAITYDPAFDDAARMRDYALTRGVLLNEEHRMLRAVSGWQELRAHFELGVNFVGSIVNRHRVELLVLDAAGCVRESFERVQWLEEQVIAAAEALDPPRA